MSDNIIFDLAILGAGPGGYVAAIRASQLGLNTALIEKHIPGGVCLNIGCIPSKNLIHQAESFNSIPQLEKTGLVIDKTKFDYAKVNAQSRAVSENLTKGVAFLIKKNKISFFRNEGKLTGDNEITLNDGKKISAKNIIIATGSSPRSLKGFEFDGKNIISSDDFLMLKELPRKMLIIGGGVIGCEFAFIASSFGTEVTLIEALPQILPNEDHETVAVLERAFRKMKVEVKVNTKAISFEYKENKLLVKLNNNGNEEMIETEKILSVTGRSPNTDRIGLENIGIKTENGFVPVKDFYETEKKNIYAVGDIVSTPMLAHAASKEGEIAVEHIAGIGHEKKLALDILPSCVYTEPQIASFGATEKKLIELNIKYKKSVLQFRAIGKTQAVGKNDGIIKILVSEEDNSILGCHIAGKDATEIIHELILAKKNNIDPKVIAHLVHAHPTISEGIMEAMRGLDNWTIHV